LAVRKGQIGEEHQRSRSMHVGRWIVFWFDWRCILQYLYKSLESLTVRMGLKLECTNVITGPRPRMFAYFLRQCDAR